MYKYNLASTKWQETVTGNEELIKLEFGGESPLTMRARCSAFRYCPDPLGIVTAEELDKLEFT